MDARGGMGGSLAGLDLRAEIGEPVRPRLFGRAVEGPQRPAMIERERPRPERQRPRRASHDSTGTLSYGLIGVSHCGQRDRGRDSDSPRGSR